MLTNSQALEKLVAQLICGRVGTIHRQGTVLTLVRPDERDVVQIHDYPTNEKSAVSGVAEYLRGLTADTGDTVETYAGWRSARTVTIATTGSVKICVIPVCPWPEAVGHRGFGDDDAPVTA